ncbi:MAG: hypothetical protein ABIS06_04270 [Vicinamibacterales bacterium]
MLLVPIVAQDRQAVSEPGYLLIDAAQARSRLLRTTNISRIRDRLAEAGNQGYGLVSFAGSSSSANLLLKRDGAGPRTYRLVFNGREGGFLNDLNKAAADGLRVVPGTVKAFEDAAGTTWMAVVAPAPDAPRATYLVVKGTEAGEKALDGASAAGRSLVAILGRIGMTSANTLLFFEQHAPGPSTGAATVHRIIANSRTSTTEKEIIEAAAGGFRLLGAGFGNMTVVMSRSNDAANEPIDYRLIAMISTKTAVDELNEAGVAGFRLTAISEHGPEGVMVIHRKPGAADHFEYQLLRLEEDTANRTLLDAEADGYRIAQLFSDIVVLERPGR